MDEYKYLLLFSGWVCGDLLGLSGLRPLLLVFDGLSSGVPLLSRERFDCRNTASICSMDRHGCTQVKEALT